MECRDRPHGSWFRQSPRNDAGIGFIRPGEHPSHVDLGWWRRRAPRALSLGAVILVLASLVLPWWTQETRAQGGTLRDHVYPFTVDDRLRNEGIGDENFLVGALMLASFLCVLLLAGAGLAHNRWAWIGGPPAAIFALTAALIAYFQWPRLVDPELTFFWSEDFAIFGIPYTLAFYGNAGWFLAILGGILCPAVASVLMFPRPVHAP